MQMILVAKTEQRRANLEFLIVAYNVRIRLLLSDVSEEKTDLEQFKKECGPSEKEPPSGGF